MNMGFQYFSFLKFSVTFFSLLLTFVSNAQNSSTSTMENIKTSGNLKVCTTGGFVPFTSYSSKGWEGFDIDMMNAFSEKLKAKLEIINYNIDGIIPALSTKKCDIIAAGMTITEERKKSVLFSDSYFIDGIVYMFRSDNNEVKTLGKVEALNNKKYKIGVKLGTTNDFYAQKNLSKAEISKYNEYGDVINALRNKKVDVLIIDLNHGKTISKKFNGIFEFKDTGHNNENLGVAARPDDKELINQFNTFLKDWKSSGNYEKVHNKYFN